MRGFEPLTPWLQTRCSAGLSYIPAKPMLRRSAVPDFGFLPFDTLALPIGPIAQSG